MSSNYVAVLGVLFPWVWHAIFRPLGTHRPRMVQVDLKIVARRTAGMTGNRDFVGGSVVTGAPGYLM